MRLYTKIVLLITCISMMIAGVSAIVSGNMMRKSIIEELEQKALVIVKALGKNITHEVVVNEVIPVQKALQQVVQDIEEVEYAFIYDFDNNLFAHSFERNFPKALLKKTQDVFGHDTSLVNRYQTDESFIFEISYPLINGLTAGIHIGVNENYAYYKAAHLRNKVFTLSLLITFLGIYIGVVLSRHFTLPLSKLANSMDAFGKGQEFEPDLLIRGSIETNKLTNSFKQMIAERKKTEMQIRKLSLAVEQSPNIIVITDIHANIEYVNPIFTKKTGYTLEEAIGENPRILKSGETQPEVYKELWETIKSGRAWRGEFINKRKNGERYLESVYIAPIKNTEGVTTHFVAVKEDITERRKDEESLIKAQKLESIGMLAGGIAHDFNNYLQGIMGYIMLAEAQIGTNDQAKESLKEALKIIMQSKDLSLKLVTFSKGGNPIKKTILISQLIKDSVTLAMSASRFNCQIAAPDSLWPVYADKGQLGQVFSNIIINAKQAMPNGGKVNTFAENIEINKNELHPLKEGKYVKITIKDHGVGISHENLQKIFDPYFTTKKSGNGLGLSTCFSIIKKHGGGTTFYIYLPASMQEKQEPGQANIESVEKASSNCRGKILLMDDEKSFRAVTAEHLKLLKYEVDDAEDGAAAVALYKEAFDSHKPFDAVIMDLMVPGKMGGVEATGELLKMDPDARVIITSCYVNNSTMAEYKKYGFKSSLSKPYETDELDEALQNVIVEKD